ncbi:MAG: hypothetical protein IIX54_04090 [Clostridia bacterium]|nr:hypothetical protein [Clostridia bacterium]
MFFNYVKNKIRNKNILWSIISIVVMFVAVLLAISNGFSSETEWKYGFRFSDTGIPIPNWVISCLFIIIALIFLGLLISSVKDLFTNTTYNKIIKAAQEIGDISFIDQTLQNLQKNNLAKGGDLRYNNFLFFYMKGTEVFLFPTKSINSIQPIKETGKNTECYVNVRSATENVKIYTKELNLVPLANDILYYVRAAQ